MTLRSGTMEVCDLAVRVGDDHLGVIGFSSDVQCSTRP
jgi:hypothetical protein